MALWSLLPRGVEEDVRRTISERGLGTNLVRVERVGGGCINNGAELRTDSGTALFVKWNDDAPPGMFEAEADGLSALRRAAALSAPDPLAWSAPGARPAWLLMEYLSPGRASPQTAAELGRGLARLHASSGEPSFGWHRDNWIGSLPQNNRSASSWGAFWRERRLVPQLTSARQRGFLRDRALDRLVELVPSALSDVQRSELVHGDLWSGNWFAGPGGEPVVIDPAVYRGHGEVDLAMSELFGGFGPDFFRAYSETHGVSDAYGPYRRDLYQLYYLLVHLNLFGRSYEADCLGAARRVLAVLGA
jgi:protein-ribulosamine 3-kinase